MTDRPTAAQLIAAVADPGSFSPWDTDVTPGNPLGFEGYPERLTAVREATGSTEAVVTGRAQLGGRPVALIAGEFGFLGGSIGAATGERVTRAFERAAGARLPLLAMPLSGGTRMQEGTHAFVAMIKAAAAAREYREQGLPYLVWLGNPTMGGVLASWGSLGHVTFMDPDAIAGFTGRRIVEAVTGEPLPAESQQAANLLAHGLVDDVVPLEDLAERVERVLRVCPGGAGGVGPKLGWAGGVGPKLDGPAAAATGGEEPSAPPDAWASVQCSRRPDRPGARALLDVIADSVTPLRGDRTGSDDPACIVALARVTGVPAVVIAQDRSAGGRMGPGGYRKARRAMELAQQLGLALVTIVDTPGAEVSAASETAGLSGELARCLATMTGLTVPTVAVLLGEGAGGGALALLPADRVVAAENAWLSPILPEGASVILHRTPERAPEVAAAQGISSAYLRRLGLVDQVVPEDGCAADDAARFLTAITAGVGRALHEAVGQDPGRRLQARRERHRRLG